MILKKLLKSGEVLWIREAEKQDASQLIEHLKGAAKETEHLTFGAGEFKKTVEEEEEIIQRRKNMPNSILLIAEIDEKIVGTINLKGKKQLRLKHTGQFGLVVRKDHWGKGIGSVLIQSMLDWAKSSGVIKKINLNVKLKNTTAISLYKKFGFKKEGLIRRYACIDGEFYDAYLMGILID